MQTDRRPLDPDIVKKLPAGKTAWDADVVGFGVRAYAGGVRSFFLNYRVAGRERRFTIGSFPTWSVGTARTRARELRREVDQGRDPAGEKRERREAPTIQDLIDRYVVEHLPRKAPGSQKDDRRMLSEIGRYLGQRTKVSDVHDGDIRDMHRKISESASNKGGFRTTHANRVLALCSTLFSLSLRSMAGENEPWRNAVQGNPCRGVVRNPEHGRERFFSEVELAAIGDALTAYRDQVAANAGRLVMLTGCRPKEALFATWSEFDEPGIWVKPAATTKQRKLHRLPLSPGARELIERLRRGARNDGDLVFPGRVAGEPRKDLTELWRFVRRRTGFGEGARLYDLRHSFASIGVAGGLSLPIIGKLLGHSHSSTTARYAHLSDDPLREAANKIGAVIGNAGRPSDKIKKIRP